MSTLTLLSTYLAENLPTYLAENLPHESDNYRFSKILDLKYLFDLDIKYGSVLYLYPVFIR